MSLKEKFEKQFKSLERKASITCCFGNTKINSWTTLLEGKE